VLLSSQGFKKYQERHRQGGGGGAVKKSMQIAESRDLLWRRVEKAKNPRFLVEGGEPVGLASLPVRPGGG